MAVKKCKECGNDVSTKAKKCPNCGAKAPKRTSLLVWILAGVIAFVFYMVSQGKLESPTPREKAPLSTEQQEDIKIEAKRRAQGGFEQELIFDAKKAVSALLKDPESAQFKDVFFNETEEGGAVVCGQVNSKNSLGTYSGFQRFISNGKTTFLEEQTSNIADTWVSVCLPDKP